MPLMGLAFARAALDSLESIPHKMRAQVIKKAKALILNPHGDGTKKLRGVEDNGEPVYRERSGDYRILYVIREVEVIVLDIGHRKDVYR